jgi:hypothetical protein
MPAANKRLTYGEIDKLTQHQARELGLKKIKISGKELNIAESYGDFMEFKKKFGGFIKAGDDWSRSEYSVKEWLKAQGNSGSDEYFKRREEEILPALFPEKKEVSPENIARDNPDISDIMGEPGGDVRTSVNKGFHSQKGISVRDRDPRKVIRNIREAVKKTGSDNLGLGQGKERRFISDYFTKKR